MNEGNMTITMPLETYNEVKKVSEFQSKIRKSINSSTILNHEYIVHKLNEIFEGKFKEVKVKAIEVSDLDPFNKDKKIVFEFEV